MKKQTKKGFTLVELVIVIAVIAILSAILIPTFGNVISQANETAAMDNAKTAYTNFLVKNGNNSKDATKYVSYADDEAYILVEPSTTAIKYAYHVKDGTLTKVEIGNNSNLLAAVKAALELEENGSITLNDSSVPVEKAGAGQAYKLTDDIYIVYKIAATAGGNTGN